MDAELDDVITVVGELFEKKILPSSNVYCVVDVNSMLEARGYDPREDLEDRALVVPIKEDLGGLNVLIGGDQFDGFRQFQNGVVAHPYIADLSSLEHAEYRAAEEMILSFGP